MAVTSDPGVLQDRILPLATRRVVPKSSTPAWPRQRRADSRQTPHVRGSAQLPEAASPARSLQALNPEVCCCFMSGDTGAYTQQELLQRGAVRVFAKPFCLADLMSGRVQLATKVG